MIASVEGKVGAVAFDSLVIEVGGIGYRVFAAPAILVTAQPGSTIKLHTYHLVREDQQSLFGFRTTEDLGFFNLLLTVTGVGPKVALAIVGSRPTPDDAADALAIAVCIANGLGQVGRSTRTTGGVMDRAAIAPIERGSTPYERAVREALATEKRAARGPAR